jgi:hypothetical protein
VNANLEPVSEHAPRSALRPLSFISGPAEQPVLEEVVEMLRDERLDLLDGVQIGAKEDRELVAGFRDREPWAIVVE